MKARPKKGLLCLFPHDYPYKSQVRSLSYIKQTEKKRKKRKNKKERTDLFVTAPPPIPKLFLQKLTCGTWRTRIPSLKAKEGKGWSVSGHKTTT